MSILRKSGRTRSYSLYLSSCKGSSPGAICFISYLSNTEWIMWFNRVHVFPFILPDTPVSKRHLSITLSIDRSPPIWGALSPVPGDHAFGDSASLDGGSTLRYSARSKRWATGRSLSRQRPLRLECWRDLP